MGKCLYSSISVVRFKNYSASFCRAFKEFTSCNDENGNLDLIFYFFRYAGSTNVWTAKETQCNAILKLAYDIDL